MGIKIGDIDIGSQVVDNEFRIRLLTKIIESVINSNALKAPAPEELVEIRKQLVKELQQKYPNSGIKYVDGRSIE